MQNNTILLCLLKTTKILQTTLKVRLGQNKNQNGALFFQATYQRHPVYQKALVASMLLPPQPCRVRSSRVAVRWISNTIEHDRTLIERNISIERNRISIEPIERNRISIESENRGNIRLTRRS